MWIKYKHKFAYGSDKKWSWRFIGPADFYEIEEIVDNITDEHSYSDKYRGIDYEVAECPPSDVLESKIKSCENSARYYTKHLEYLTALYIDIERESFNAVPKH